MWFLILSLSACVTGWAQITHKTSGFRITTKSICQVRQSTRESYSAGPDRDSNSTLRWEKPCWLPLDLLEDILSTSAGFQTGIWSGLTLHTQGDRSRLRVSPDFHRKKNQLYKWCHLYFPCWVPHFWPYGRPERTQPLDLNSLD